MSPTTLQRRDGYDRLSIVFHWATLALLIATFASIEGRVLFERGTAIRTVAKELHYVLGLLVLLATLARLSHRLGDSARPSIRPAPAPALMTAAHLMAALLYAALLVTPAIVLLSVQVLGDSVDLGFGLTLPTFIGADPEAGEMLEHLHSFLGDAMYVLIGAHAGAALVHHSIVRDTTLSNMAPALSKIGSTGNATP